MGRLRRFWSNKGGTWGPPRDIRQLPANLDLSDAGTAFADMDGNGATDVLLVSESPIGYIRNEPGHGWTHRMRFRQAPSFDPKDGNLRLLDINGDGLVDAMVTSLGGLYTYINRGEEGWDGPFRTTRDQNDDQLRDISFSDRRTKLADMTGDGLVDIVWVHGGRIDYWPNLGYGRFGSRISLPINPSIGYGFDPDCLYLVDLNGDGVTDIVYIESDRLRLWINCQRQLVVGSRRNSLYSKD